MKVLVRKYDTDNVRKARVEIEIDAEAAEVEYPDELGRALQYIINHPFTEVREQ